MPCNHTPLHSDSAASSSSIRIKAYMMPAWGIMAGILNLEPGDSQIQLLQVQASASTAVFEVGGRLYQQVSYTKRNWEDGT